MLQIDDNTRFERSHDCPWSGLGTEVLIMDMTRRRSHRLTGAAAAVWYRAIERESVAEIVAFLVREYEVDSSTARRDAVATLNQLVEVGALKVV